ncbi:MAG TPA: cytochrome c oxidase assembly protein [Steroidobacteraceae bacterium]|nr:cytochrome c oxidase assembly protein [Steroidobacteraceae bacterium]
MSLLRWLLPWDFSVTVLTCCLTFVLLYARGVHRSRQSGTAAPARWRQSLFYLGMLLIYIPLQTRYDYFAQHMFWMHRLQHFLLHDFASLMVALAFPWPVLGAGLPSRWHAPLRRLWQSAPLRATYAILTQPLIAFTLFVGLIYLWLWPSVHFRAMLSLREYKCMNWSVAVDGLLFWSLILDPRSKAEGAAMHLGPRIFLALLTMVPETIIGAYLSLHQGVVYTVYAVCGRLWPVDAVTDQQLGGLIVWIPASMMCSFAALIVLRRWMYHDELVRSRGRVVATVAGGAATRPFPAVARTAAALPAAAAAVTGTALDLPALAGEP